MILWKVYSLLFGGKAVQDRPTFSPPFLVIFSWLKIRGSWFRIVFTKVCEGRAVQDRPYNRRCLKLQMSVMRYLCKVYQCLSVRQHNHHNALLLISWVVLVVIF